MEIRKDSHIVRLVSGSGIKKWRRIGNREQLNLCPFFWMVVVSVVLLPLRPFLNAESYKMRSIPRWLPFVGWVYAHIHYFNLIWSVTYEYLWLGVKFEKLTYQPDGVLALCFVLVFVVEVLIIAIIIIMALMFCVGFLGILFEILCFMLSSSQFMQNRRERRWSKLPKQQKGTRRKQVQAPLPKLEKKTNATLEFFKNLFELVRGYFVAKKQKFCPSIELTE